jgi:hypothetical protein
VPRGDEVVVLAGKLRKLWDSLSDLRSSLCERQLERTVLRPALLPVKTVYFTQFFHHACHTAKLLSLTERVQGAVHCVLMTVTICSSHLSLKAAQQQAASVV